MEKLTLKKLYNTEFPQLYWKFFKNEEVSDEEIEAILAIGLYLVGLENNNLNKLGYRLFLLYSKVTCDYKPLYELSLNKGFIPIAQFIVDNLHYNEKYGNIYIDLNNINNDIFVFGDSYRTIGQYKLYESVKESKHKSQIIVAPTSYGKTELILSIISDNKLKKICVITPTKSLLAQTKKRIINHFGYRKIVTYPEMYNEKDESIIAILTQERLLRLLQNNPKLVFDILIVDEAHNLLEGFSKENMRSVILSSVIIICNKRNDNLICKYLTPFLKSKDSLDLKYLSNNIEWYKVIESIKSEVFIFYDIENNKKYFIDQFASGKKTIINVSTNQFEEDSDIVIENSDIKNLIYLNSPKKLELFTEELSLKMSNLDEKRLNKASDDLREYVHENYKLADYIIKGIIYHHGSIPEPIRYFIEDLYRELPEIKMLVTNSTLLEGVNLPATKIFILDPKRGTKYLTASSFRNLIGRVCRFGEIFNKKTGDLNYLLPEINIVKGKYCNKKFNTNSFIKKFKILVEDYDNINDELNNPLLVKTSSKNEEIKKAEEILENISVSDNITKDYNKKPKTEIGRLCFENNINIFDILEMEEELEKEVNSIIKIKNLDEVFTILSRLFFSKINYNESKYNNIMRLNEKEAQNFYKMLISWRIFGLTIKEMTNKIVAYWNSLEYEKAKFVYVGKWGDKTRGGGFKQYWTDITKKDNIEKVNLAIVRLKEEFDLIDNEIIKYIEILNSLDLIDEKLYLQIRFGTDDKEKIALLNCGISNALTKLLEEKYKNYYKVNVEQGTVFFKMDLVSKMIENNENGVLVSEVRINSKD